MAVQAGNGTHTGSMLGYCPDCGLYHGSQAARSACARLLAAVEPTAELAAWRELKQVVAEEQGDLPPRAA